MVLFVQAEHGEYSSQVASHFHRESPAFRKLVRIGLVMHGGKFVIYGFHLGLAHLDLAGGIQVQVQEGDPLVYLTAGIHPELASRRSRSYTYRPVAKEGLPFGKGSTRPAQEQSHSHRKFSGHFPIQKKHSYRAPYRMSISSTPGRALYRKSSTETFFMTFRFTMLYQLELPEGSTVKSRTGEKSF